MIGGDAPADAACASRTQPSSAVAPPAATKKAPETTTGEQDEVAVNVIHSFGQSITTIRV